MKVRLSNIAAQRILVALRGVDNNEAIKLSGMTRLDIARNINRLMPVVVDYEKVIQRRHRDMQPGDANRAANSVISADIEKVAERSGEYDLIEIEPANLRLDDNPRITGDMIAALAPILKDFDTIVDEKKSKAK